MRRLRSPASSWSQTSRNGCERAAAHHIAYLAMIKLSEHVCGIDPKCPGDGRATRQPECAMSSSGSHATRRWREMDSNPRSPWGQGSQSHADYPPIGRPQQKTLKRMLDWFERNGVA